MSTTSQLPTKKPLAFTGRLQPVRSRLPAKPMVDYDKGGSDFRCPLNVTSFGKQVLTGTHLTSETGVRFGGSARFRSSKTIGIGPAGLGQVSSMKKQAVSNRRSAESCNFGTSDRDGAWKLYTIYTEKRF